MKSISPNRLKVAYLFFVLLFLGIQNASAGGLEYRKYAGEFMEIGVAARVQALGGTFSAISGNVAAAYYNPAGLFGLENMQISFMHTQQLIASVNYDYLAIGRRQNEKRVWAFSLIRLGVDNIQDSRNAQVFLQGNPDNWRINMDKVTRFNAADYLFNLAVAQEWRHGWILGGNLKIISRNLADNSAYGLGLDLGLQRSVTPHLRFGASLKNATSTLIFWDTGIKEMVKPSLSLGGAYFLGIERINSSFLPVFDVIIRTENRQKSSQANLGAVSADFSGGVEYAYRGVLYIRGGIDEIRRLNVGAGVQIPHIRIDYAFTNYDNELGNSHRIGLLVSF